MYYYKINKDEERKKWHVWFAWYPVTVKTMPDKNYKKVWLEKVLRCGTLIFDSCDVIWYYEYKEIE